MPPKKESKETAQCQVSEERAAALAVAARSFIYGREEALGPRMERTGRRTSRRDRTVVNSLLSLRFTSGLGVLDVLTALTSE